ncbi:fungal-specific transcription factor domain-containing protein [Bisporella sp. PMI_857]|nr:fungal-specific transcription factor domain-containing protein [Bisporella sp. PMI_857]
MLACTRCKQKKLKCDGQIPKCQNCVKVDRGGCKEHLDVDCLVGDPATGLHRPRDYMQSLEARVAYLEGILQQVRPDVALDHFVGYQSTNQRVDDAEGSPATQTDVVDISSDVALLCVSAAGREPHYFGPSSALSFSRVFSSALRLSKEHGGSARGNNEQSGLRSTLNINAPLRLPSISAASSFSKAYFNNVHPQYPFLHHPTFRIWEDECTQANQNGNLQDVKPISIFFVLMVYAIGSLIVNPSQQSSAEAFYSMALDYIEDVIHLDSLESIQAILSCAVYSIKSPVGASIWKLSGMAIRHCIELGYHRSRCKFSLNTDPLAVEMSKRVFWVAYDIDRAAAFTLGRPFGISDDVIDVELPLDIDDSDIAVTVGSSSPNYIGATPTHMTGAIHIIKLRLIWSKISDNLYPSVSKGCGHSTKIHANMIPTVTNLRHELEEWHASTPSQLDHVDTDPRSVFASQEWFHLAYCHTILLLYRHYLTTAKTPQTNDINATSNFDLQNAIDDAFLECTERSREMCLGYRRSYQNSNVQYTWGSLHILFLAGLTYLHCLWSSNKVRSKARKVDVINTCTSCTMVLVIIAERWSVAAPYRDIFEALSEKTIAMICENSSSTTGHQSFDDNQSGPLFLSPNSTHLDEQIMNFGDIFVPDESEWLVQDFLHGFMNQ